jgi:hypothetical protein
LPEFSTATSTCLSVSAVCTITQRSPIWLFLRRLETVYDKVENNLVKLDAVEHSRTTGRRVEFHRHMPE